MGNWQGVDVSFPFVERMAAGVCLFRRIEVFLGVAIMIIPAYQFRSFAGQVYCPRSWIAWGRAQLDVA